jgi:hypothetical protein
VVPAIGLDVQQWPNLALQRNTGGFFDVDQYAAAT